MRAFEVSLLHPQALTLLPAQPCLSMLPLGAVTEHDCNFWLYSHDQPCCAKAHLFPSCQGQECTMLVHGPEFALRLSLSNRIGRSWVLCEILSGRVVLISMPLRELPHSSKKWWVPIFYSGKSHQWNGDMYGLQVSCFEGWKCGKFISVMAFIHCKHFFMLTKGENSFFISYACKKINA